MAPSLSSAAFLLLIWIFITWIDRDTLLKGQGYKLNDYWLLNVWKMHLSDHLCYWWGCIKNVSQESMKRKEKVQNSRLPVSVWLYYLCSLSLCSSDYIPPFSVFLLSLSAYVLTTAGALQWTSRGTVVGCVCLRRCSIDKHPWVYRLHKSHLLHTCTHAYTPETLTFSSYCYISLQRRRWITLGCNVTLILLVY